MHIIHNTAVTAHFNNCTYIFSKHIYHMHEYIIASVIKGCMRSSKLRKVRNMCRSIKYFFCFIQKMGYSMHNFADAFAHHHSLHRATKCRVMCKTLKQTVGELKAILGIRITLKIFMMQICQFNTWSAICSLCVS